MLTKAQLDAYWAKHVAVNMGLLSQLIITLHKNITYFLNSRFFLAANCTALYSIHNFFKNTTIYVQIVNSINVEKKTWKMIPKGCREMERVTDRVDECKAEGNVSGGHTLFCYCAFTAAPHNDFNHLTISLIALTITISNNSLHKLVIVFSRNCYKFMLFHIKLRSEKRV